MRLVLLAESQKEFQEHSGRTLNPIWDSLETVTFKGPLEERIEGSQEMSKRSFRVEEKVQRPCNKRHIWETCRNVTRSQGEKIIGEKVMRV